MIIVINETVLTTPHISLAIVEGVFSPIITDIKIITLKIGAALSKDSRFKNLYIILLPSFKNIFSI